VASFTLDISKWANKQKTNTRVVFRKIAFDVFRRIILRTPVNTGRARGNWFTTIGVQSSEKTDSTTRDATQPASRVVNAWQPQDNIAAIITNNLPYIETLERGRVGNKGSLQAPQGMVKITLAEFGQIVESEAASVRNN
jgi:hypothetical protein